MILTEYLKYFIGCPYIWGGDGTGKHHGGFDCSGLVLEGLWALGLYTGHDTSAQGLYNNLSVTDGWKPSDPARLSDGDLLFFGKSIGSITHTAVSLGDGLMLEAGGGGSKCTSETNSTGFVRIRPVANRKDLVATLYHAE